LSPTCICRKWTASSSLSEFERPRGQRTSRSLWSAATQIRIHRREFAASGRTPTSRNPILPPLCGKCWSGSCMRIHRHRLKLIVTLLAPLVHARAQSPHDLKSILDRLDRLENENRELREEVRQLREQIGPVAPAEPEVQPSLAERADIQERRTE